MARLTAIDDVPVETLPRERTHIKWKWGTFNNCVSFASEVFESTTGIDVDADDIMGIETPRELGEHILELNNYPPKSQCCDGKSSP